MESGFIIQSNEASMYSLCKEYTGLAERKSWPLDNTDVQEKLENQWTIDYLENYNSGKGLTLDAIDDMEILSQYINICREKQIDIRILYVAISQVDEKKSIEIEQDKIEMYKNPIDLGYDLIYPNGNDFYYSALNDEREALGESGLIHKLNRFGTFSELSLLDEYIDWRKKNLQPMEVEPISDFVKARVILLKNFIK